MKTITLVLILLVTILTNAQEKNQVTTTTFKASITCENCEAKIMKQLPYEKGVKDVRVDVDNKLVTVSYKSLKNTDERLNSAIKKLGFQVVTIGQPSIIAVNGNCDMCKERIEKATLQLDGVDVAIWSAKEKQLSVFYDDSMINLGMIEQAVAAVGHDAGSSIAKDEVYASLPDCCKYR
ncbi:heavy-metal-associated domain-containing protein [Carboxylicivirga sp. M1479]|uniref:heavy-metal-associated domain-containing protein n=1 Tax=Carboxylicivirga sp. M1479 TaxID=2594476 RepID=UPI0011778FCE|nr:cation transporter [Carboxylicivirga sp. M1479]TRX72053.1 hypothetical protein FNN09_03345 [Carboxylicivirga sp. M1479]